MTPEVRSLNTEGRRAYQRSIGISFELTGGQLPSIFNKKERDTSMNTQTNEVSSKSVERAEEVIKHLIKQAVATPTYKELALHELKRASVYVPMLATTALGVLWMNKRFIAKTVIGA